MEGSLKNTVSVFVQFVKILPTFGIWSEMAILLFCVFKVLISHTAAVANSISNLEKRVSSQPCDSAFFFRCLALEVRPVPCLKKTSSYFFMHTKILG